MHSVKSVSLTGFNETYYSFTRYNHTENHKVRILLQLLTLIIAKKVLKNNNKSAIEAIFSN